MKLFFITEGSQRSGLGHLYRVRSFALNCLKEPSFDFRIYPEISSNLLSIFSDLDDKLLLNLDYKNLINEIILFKPDYIIFDLLKFNTMIFEQLKFLGIKTVSLSPIFNHLNNVDLLFTRGSLKKPDGPKVFSGIEYVVIGNHVRRIDNAVYNSNLKTKQLSIAVALGGTDAPNKTLKVIESLAKYNKPLLIWVMLGEGYSHSYTQLVDIIKKNCSHEIVLVRTNDSMWNILQNCVLAITAGGITAYEAAYAGLPTINIVAKEEHKSLLTDLIYNDIAFINGVFPNYSEDELIELINKLNCDRKLLFNMHIKTKSIAKILEENKIYQELLFHMKENDVEIHKCK